jgi:protein-disulfide isomerase
VKNILVDVVLLSSYISGMLKTILKSISDIFTSSVFFSNVVTLSLVVLLCASSFLIGSLYTENKSLKNGGTPTAGGTAAAQPTEKVGDVPKPTDKDLIRGNKNAEVALIEYSDFDCPFCVRFHPTAKQALDFYGDKLMWVYRDFPLTQLHPDAYKKAIAGKCVAELNGNDTFWKFADIIYTRDEKLPEMYGIAAEIGVNAAKFKDCYDGNKTDAKVKADQASGDKAGVTGTPGNFLMNVKTGKVVALRGAVPLEDVKTAYDSVLK